MELKNRIKKISAGLIAGLCAVSVIGSPVTVNNISASAAMTTENTAFPTADDVIAQAATLLGAPYGWGYKGYTGVYYQGSYSPLSLDTVRSQGVDCSGLIYYTLTHLGYSTSGFTWNDPVPVDTYHWLTVNDNCTVTYKGITSKIDVEKANIPYAEHPYWECADGSIITPGSVVIADNLSGEDHSWIYMGEFDSRDDVISYLTAKVRHDIKNYITCALRMAEKKDFEELTKFLEKLSEEKIDSITSYVNVKRSVLGAVLNSKISNAKRKNIDIQCYLLSEFDSISDMDMGILLANLLDNALEACEKNVEKPEIIIKTWAEAGYYFLEISNTVESDILINNPELKTNKDNSDLHGVGLRTVRDIVKKYDGMMSFEQKGCIFHVYVSLEKTA